ncbi:MAG: hypothetical protein RSC05_04430 [Acinetobacter sp.]
MKLGDYKIKVTTEAESKEAQELFNQILGLTDIFDVSSKWVCSYYDAVLFYDLLPNYEFKELTLPQLRDLVVLHRNDVSDATHIGKYCGDFYVTSDGVIYGWNDIDAWERSSATTMDIIEPINKELISGADALRALADGKEVEYSFVGDWFDIDLKTELGIFHRTDAAFRLKPKTITLNIEIPAPFEPKYGDFVFVMDSSKADGWTSFIYQASMTHKVIYGAWRTEEEIKQVVSALRGALKNG